MTARPQGYGREPFSDPFGAGGPLFVMRAQAIAGQVVRVVFDEEPLHRSAAGSEDALNPANYEFTVVAGTGIAPQAVGVDETIVVGPTVAVQSGDERGVDVHTDRQLVIGIGYLVKVSRVRAQLGGALGGPGTADFVGIVRLGATRPAARKVDLSDLANDAIEGRFVVDNSGDLAPQDGRASFKKRVLRRIMTTKNAFAFLPGYGIGLRLKQPARIVDLPEMKADIIQQIQQEPETKRVDVTLQLLAVGMVVVSLRVLKRDGSTLELQTEHRSDETIRLV